MTTYILSFLCFSYVFHQYKALGSAHVSQERALVDYYDPAYVGNPQAFTFRAKRGDLYKSNVTITTFHEWGNNISVAISYKGKLYGTDIYMKEKACDALKTDWVNEVFSKYMHRKLACPIPPGIYGVYNFELPPKNFPFPIPKGEGVITTTLLKDGKKKVLHILIKVKIL
ncbi:uncharacterized protein LOC128676119 [Plodia interpunctella]|uniref:uncharacterized protein LOC128676119 n=1 Tax=Plodia interpunctella TaxID=58824 RepID=UPI002367EDCE|nr:uncharacterized protein LOC128676119 [Plodia interpunctella]